MKRVLAINGGVNYNAILANRDEDTLGLGFRYAELRRDLVDDLGRRIPLITKQC
jgi:hypothetical protein